jgi:hypothetical protein
VFLAAAHYSAGLTPLTILEISKAEFDQLLLERLWPEENEWAWLAAQARRLVGVIVLDPATGIWGYSVCERACDKSYRRIAYANEYRDGLTAKRRLVEAMQVALVKCA